MSMITIKNCWNGRTLYECEAEDRRAAVIKAVRENANLAGANLAGADLAGANLAGAIFTGADLAGANLDPIRADVIASILGLPDEIPFLRQALVDGRINGSTYYDKCACLAGTMAQACGVPFDVFRDSGRMPINSTSPRERWFIGIRPGDTPETSAVVRITLGWIDEALVLVALIRARSAVPVEATP